jgi:MFS family permease
LYIIDAVVGLLVGPFLGIVADRLGRKFIASFYPINNIISTSMRLSGVVPLAFSAQFFTGVSGGILATAYEAWLNYEINKLYKDHKNYIQHYKKHIFATVSFYDTVTSMCVILVSAVIYVIN